MDWQNLETTLLLEGILISGAGCLAAWLMTPVVRKLATKFGVMDYPDARKKHADPIPYLGGLAIFFGFIASLLTAFLFKRLDGLGTDLTWLLLGALVIISLGVFDDWKGVKPKLKLSAQCLAGCLLAQMASVQIFAEHLLLFVKVPEQVLQPWVIYIFALAGTSFQVMAWTNAMNLIDGLDGLCAGTSSIAQAGFLVIALFLVADNSLPYGGELAVPVALATIAGSLGYLWHNYPPAKIFMGDCGSLLLGYLAVASVLLISGTNDQVMSIKVFMAGVFACGLPLVDLTVSMLRRKLRGKPMMQPDALHLHHQVRYLTGLPVWKTIKVLWAYQVLCVFIAVLPMLDFVWNGVAPILAMGVLGLTLGAGVAGSVELDRRRELKEELALAAMDDSAED